MNRILRLFFGQPPVSELIQAGESPQRESPQRKRLQRTNFQRANLQRANLQTTEVDPWG